MPARNRRHAQRAPLLRRVRPVLGAGLRVAVGMVFAAVLVFTAGLAARVDLNTLVSLEQVALLGEFRHLEPDALDAVLAGHARGFFALDLDRLRLELSELPWVDSVRLRKRWPDTLEIAITEPMPVARWGEDHLVDRYGAIFGPVDLASWAFLPALEGGEGRQVELMQRYLEVSARLADVGLGVSGVRESTRRAWTIRLEGGGKVLMGRDGDLSRLDQLVRLMPLLREHNPEELLARVDLRYAQGAAVAWQTASGHGETGATIQ